MRDKWQHSSRPSTPKKEGSIIPFGHYQTDYKRMVQTSAYLAIPLSALHMEASECMRFEVLRFVAITLTDDGGSVLNSFG